MTPIRISRFVLLLLGFLGLGFPFLSMSAQGEPLPQSQKESLSDQKKLGDRLFLEADLVGGVNPMGLAAIIELNYRKSDGYNETYSMPSSYRQVGLGLTLTPAFARTSLLVEWMPWIFLGLRGQYDGYAFFGVNDALLSFPSSNSPHGDDALDKRDDEEKAFGQRLLFRPTLQLKWGPVLFRNRTDAAFYFFSGKGPYYYEREYDTLLKDGDFLLANKTHILWEVEKSGKEKRILAGPFYEWVRAWEADIIQQRIGLGVYWVPRDKILPLDRPRIYVQAGYHLQDPNRQDTWFIQTGFGFDLDLR
jgi:hypothetical protein